MKHFTELLNQPSELDESILEDIEQLPIDESLDAPITEAELDKSLNNTKTRKSASPDGVLPEILVHGGNRLKAFLFTITSMFWMTENLPWDVSDPNISIFFKKGDRSQCGNYGGISLLSVVDKIFADILLQKLKRIAEKVYAQSQFGYRASRSTIDGIFALRQLLENTREQRRNMYIAFVDFTKAFDSVNGDLLFVGSRACAANHYVIAVKCLVVSMSTSLANRRHSLRSIVGIAIRCRLIGFK